MSTPALQGQKKKILIHHDMARDAVGFDTPESLYMSVKKEKIKEHINGRNKTGR